MRVRFGRFGQTAIVGPLGLVGGEGSIGTIDISDSLVAKIYHRPTCEHEAKIVAMLDCPPAIVCRVDKVIRVAWPLEVLYDDKGRFIGYAMARIVRATKLFDVYHGSPNATKQGRSKILAVARDIAEVVSSLHQENVIIGDINESNMLVSGNRVSFVDADSFQVTSRGRVYRCNVCRPEFTCRELVGLSRSKVDSLREHDHFGLGVVMFLLFMRGIHPFNAGWVGPGRKPQLATRIKDGLWPYSARRSRSLVKPPKMAPPLNSLPKEFRALFHQCFDEGHRTPKNRPSAMDWVTAIESVQNVGWKEAPKQFVAHPTTLRDYRAKVTSFRNDLQKRLDASLHQIWSRISAPIKLVRQWSKKAFRGP